MTRKDEYPTNQEIIYLLGVGALLLGSILMPGLGIAAGQIYRAKEKHDFQQRQKQWKKFNKYLLKRNLKRLHEQKIVEIIEQKGQEVIKLTEKGHSKYLKFKLEGLSLKSSSWDRKWRLVLYDVSHLKRTRQDAFRRMLKQMNFYPLQKSVYLTPYKCAAEIEYLREYFNLGREVLLVEISKLENERFYRDYFSI